MGAEPPLAGRSRTRGGFTPFLPRATTKSGATPDVTLVNLNLMLANVGGYYDEENYVPLGLLYIAACLERAGYGVELVDYQLFSHARLFDPELFVGALGDTAPVVGLSCMSNLLPFAILVAERLKEAHPDRTIVLGGVGPSPVAGGIIEAFPFVDIVVEGEGELPMLAIAAGDRARLPRRLEAGDLDALPLPAYGLVDFSNYIAARSIVTSRGCPYRCAFCTEPHNFGGHVRFRAVESVVEELEWLHRLHPHSTFLFQDDTLPLDRRRFTRILAALRELSFPVQWKCFSRVDLMDDELLAEMAASGCVQVRYGIESGSNRTLERIRKGFTIEQAFDAVTRSLRHFPSVHTSFMWGFPFEEPEQFEETVRWASAFERAGATVLLFEFSPLPGSELYRQHRDSIRFSADAYSGFVLTGHEMVDRTGRMSVADRFRGFFDLVARHPAIFPGFYHYESAERLRPAPSLDRFRLTGRTSRKNQYDG